MPCLFGRVVTIAFVVTFAGCSTVHMSSVKNTSKTFNTVVVDAGHGGKDSGAYRRYGPPEKMVTLDVAQRLEHKLRESQLKTVMTRDSDVFIPLNDRVARRMRRRMQSLSAYILTTRVAERPTASRHTITPAHQWIWRTGSSKNS